LTEAVNNDADGEVEISFAPRPEDFVFSGDLHYAIGRMTIEPNASGQSVFTIAGTVRRFQADPSGSWLIVSNIRVSGVGSDLYDFDYSSGGETASSFIKAAARLQALYGSGFRAGHVFKNIFQLADTPIDSVIGPR
jgi:hypothetical protein